ncbi:hypothetical protein IQ266_24465 [filamentous cyanobacterium LEGE 11480]|uniref:Uncharacterized protein n=2 Tax=Romeriopsis TaxID=2992131 RepID=A0A928VVB8_9CYAN|nr:hypothetical protein [Romeriopsis navalis LEGE 11480]
MAVAGRRLITAGTDGNLKYWQVNWRGCLRCVESIPAHAGAILAADLSDDGDLVISAGQDGQTYLWRISQQVCLGSLPHRASGTTFVTFNPEEQLVAIGEDSGWLQILRVTGEPGQITVEQVIPAHAGAVQLINWLPGRRLLTMGADQVMRLWSLRFQPPQLLATEVDQPIAAMLPIGPQTHLWGSDAGTILVQKIPPA